MNGNRDLGWKTWNEGVRVRVSSLCKGVLYADMVCAVLLRTNCFWYSTSTSRAGPTTDGGLRGMRVEVCMSDANAFSNNSQIH